MSMGYRWFFLVIHLLHLKYYFKNASSPSYILCNVYWSHPLTIIFLNLPCFSLCFPHSLVPATSHHSRFMEICRRGRGKMARRAVTADFRVWHDSYALQFTMAVVTGIRPAQDQASKTSSICHGGAPGLLPLAEEPLAIDSCWGRKSYST